MSLMGWQSRYIEGLSRLTGEESPEVIPPGLILEDASNHDELAFLKRERICFAGITAPAIAAVSAGVVLQQQVNGLFVVTGVQVQKAVAGQVSIQVENGSNFSGTLAASFAFFRDTRWGPFATARPFAKAFTHLTGGLPASNVLKRVFVPANTWVQIPLLVVMAGVTPNVFGVFNETLNEAMDVMIDFYEREVRPEELIIS